jgi:cytoskeletal protein RodZ
MCYRRRYGICQAGGEIIARREPEAIVSIGEVLTEARYAAALSVPDVSRLTRIREGVIWDIERDDFRYCGGDFYARGHIRAIADAIGIDSAPLIEEYDATHRTRTQPPDQGPGLIAWRPPDPTGRDQRRRNRNGRRHRDRSPVPWVAAICLVVLAIFGWGVYNVAHINRHSSESAAQAAYNRSASSRASSSARGKTKPAANSPSPASSPTAASPLQAIKPVSAKAYGPYGAEGDDPQAAYEAIDGSTATRWRSDWYSTADFGNTQSGTGLMIDLGHPVIIDSATITIGTPGASIQLRGGDTPSEAASRIIGRDKDTPATALIRPEETPVRYLLIWFTQLPPDSDGTYRAVIYNVALQGHP